MRSRIEPAQHGQLDEVTTPSRPEAAPTVTIVVPTYRRPGLLRNCLASLQDQTYTDFLVLVCDNDADPEVAAIVGGLNDERFVWVPRERNLGILGNAWAGMGSATTELVMEVDDDDLLFPEALATLVPPMLADPTIAIACGAITLIGENGDDVPDLDEEWRLLTRSPLPVGIHERFLPPAARGEISLIGGVIRCSSIDWSVRPDWAGTAYDRYLAVKLAGSGGRALVLDRAVTRYRLHEEADGSKERSRQLSGAIEVLQRELDELSAHDDAKDYRGAVRLEITRTRLLLVRALLGDRAYSRALTTTMLVMARPWGVAATFTHASRQIRRTRHRVSANSTEPNRS